MDPVENTSATDTRAITRLLVAWRDGDREARSQLMALVYDHLRELARLRMRREREGPLLQTTALVHEAYLRLVGRRLDWQNRQHFFAISAEAMRQILVEHAREQRALKRGGGALTLQLNEELVGAQPAAELLELDDALERLAAFDRRGARVLELRFFGGLKIDEAAEVLGVSASTVERDQRSSLAWLGRELGWRGGDDP